MKKLVLLFIVSFLVTSCQKESQDSEKVTGLITEKAMVVSARAEASKIGTEILKKGLETCEVYDYSMLFGSDNFMYEVMPDEHLNQYGREILSKKMGRYK